MLCAPAPSVTCAFVWALMLLAELLVNNVLGLSTKVFSRCNAHLNRFPYVNEPKWQENIISYAYIARRTRRTKQCSRFACDVHHTRLTDSQSRRTYVTVRRVVNKSAFMFLCDSPIFPSTYYVRSVFRSVFRLHCSFSILRLRCTPHSVDGLTISSNLRHDAGASRRRQVCFHVLVWYTFWAHDWLLTFHRPILSVVAFNMCVFFCSPTPCSRPLRLRCTSEIDGL